VFSLGELRRSRRKACAAPRRLKRDRLFSPRRRRCASSELLDAGIVMCRRMHALPRGGERDTAESMRLSIAGGAPQAAGARGNPERPFRHRAVTE